MIIENCFTVKSQDIFFFVLVGGNPILSKVDFAGSPLTQNTRTLGEIAIVNAVLHSVLSADTSGPF